MTLLRALQGLIAACEVWDVTGGYDKPLCDAIKAVRRASPLAEDEELTVDMPDEFPEGGAREAARAVLASLEARLKEKP